MENDNVIKEQIPLPDVLVGMDPIEPLRIRRNQNNNDVPFINELGRMPIEEEHEFLNNVSYWGYLVPTKTLTKKEELESNYVRVDLDEAAKKLCSLTLPHEDSDEFLELYDKYYEILYKCRK